MTPGIYKIRGPNGAERTVQVPMPGMSVEAFEAKIESGELTLVEAPKVTVKRRRA